MRLNTSPGIIYGGAPPPPPTLIMTAFYTDPNFEYTNYLLTLSDDLGPGETIDFEAICTFNDLRPARQIVQVECDISTLYGGFHVVQHVQATLWAGVVSAVARAELDVTPAVAPVCLLDGIPVDSLSGGPSSTFNTSRIGVQVRDDTFRILSFKYYSSGDWSNYYVGAHGGDPNNVNMTDPTLGFFVTNTSGSVMAGGSNVLKIKVITSATAV